MGKGKKRKLDSMKTKILSVFIFFVVMLFSCEVRSQECSREIAADVFTIDGDELGIKPGETVCLLAGEKDFLLIKNVHGNESEPVTFINKNGAVIINTDHYFGIKMAECSFVKLFGNGYQGIEYGIQVQRVANGAGVSVGELSTDIEIAYLEVANTAIAGVYAKTDPTCDNFDATRDKFTMRNFWLHNCYIHNTADEGLYIGSSKYTGQHLPDCDTTVLPHVIEGVKIFNNIVENTGWDGIQVSSATVNCNVHDNEIKFDSQAEYPGQMSGILLGGGSKCKTYNNKIIDGKGDGIDVLGLGNHEIFNNLIVHAGQTYNPGNSNDFKHGIYVGNVVTEQDALLGIYNNTVVEPKSFGVTLANDELSKIFVLNNIITAPGQLQAIGDGAYININTSSEIINQNNFLKSSTSQVKFIDESNNDFDLQPSSPAVNYGQDLTSQGVSFDILNRSRPFHTYFDAGAYETHDPQAGIDDVESDFYKIKIFPNPFTDNLTVQMSDINIKHAGEISVELIDVSGRTVFRATNKTFKGDAVFTLKTEKIGAGSYVLKLKTEDDVKEIIVVKK